MSEYTSKLLERCQTMIVRSLGLIVSAVLLLCTSQLEIFHWQFVTWWFSVAVEFDMRERWMNDDVTNIHVDVQVLYVTCYQSRVFVAYKMIFMHFLMAFLKQRDDLTSNENKRAEVEQEKWWEKDLKADGVKWITASWSSCRGELKCDIRTKRGKKSST